MKLKTGDSVKVIAGKDKGKTGEISQTLPKSQKVVVKGVNIYKKHIKPRDGIEGGIFPLERPLPVSSVALLDPVSKKPTRVGYKVLENGKKVRFAKDSGSELDKAPKNTKPKKKKSTKTK